MTPSLRAGMRRGAAWAPLVGLVPRPPHRPNGITAMVRVRGEEPWIEPCLRSIERFADEIVVLDNDAGPTTRARLEALGRSLGERLWIEACSGLDLFALSNRGLARARFRWVIRWDADLVAHTSGAGDIGRLREDLLDIERWRYDLVYIPAVEVTGDLLHQLPHMRVRHDGQAVVWSSALRYVMNRRAVDVADLGPHDRVLRGRQPVQQSLEALDVPLYYRVRRWDRPAYFHVNVKPARHMLLRHFWLEWVDAVVGGAELSQEAYVARRVREEWGTADLAEAEQRYLEAYRALLVPFDASACGPYPELLKPYLDDPRYRLDSRAGVVAGHPERT